MDSELLKSFVYTLGNYPTLRKRNMKEKEIKLSPAHEWYIYLMEDERKVIDEKYLIGEIAKLKMDGKELIEYIYEQEVLNNKI